VLEQYPPAECEIWEERRRTKKERDKSSEDKEELEE
jgi:hypothetical protein